ncbi:putative NADH-flavin reductase [Weissella uvarum]|uniref:NAD(P)H-binding protein n=1 Tax=Weissella uvarum TaxID=1479233 RepID=UPI0019614A42|nr:NAD(P)H-binding protein [Weissella uvarum]MBM7617603.1 putative NADH-flavin reductase [Weissella uvarum]MCM0595954.1 NAD(P)H-binding protein [Weissella uvarum]
MKIAIIGATGMTGKALFNEAKERGHEVTGFVRNEARGKEILGDDANLIVEDAFAITGDQLDQFDVVIDAFANHQEPEQNLDVLTHLIHQTRKHSVRMFFILGAGPLLQANGEYVYEHLKTLPGAETWVDEPRYGVTELQVLLSTRDVNWTAISAQNTYSEGPKTDYVLGKDHLMEASDGESHVTSGNLASAVLDEIETPQHKMERFTVSDK